ncbi:transglutaminase-like cysteine peptidase [Pseudomonas borbori]
MRILSSCTFRLLRILLASSVLPGAALAAELPSGNGDGFNRSLGDMRLSSWHSLLANGGDAEDGVLLERVNQFVNRSVAFASDQDVWGEHDYWATPAQAITRGRGDCEDFAIAKYFGLLQLGVAAEKLRLTYVKDLTRNQAHMVLAYYPSPSAQPLILDNLDSRVRIASERRDLLPVYSFNNLGVFLAKAPQQVSQPANFLARWNDLSERALADGSASLPNRS